MDHYRRPFGRTAHRLHPNDLDGDFRLDDAHLRTWRDPTDGVLGRHHFGNAQPPPGLLTGGHATASSFGPPRKNPAAAEHTILGSRSWPLITATDPPPWLSQPPDDHAQGLGRVRARLDQLEVNRADTHSRNFARAPTRMHTEDNCIRHHRPPDFSSWDMPPLEFEEPEHYPQRARWENSSRHDRRGSMHVDPPRRLNITPPYDRSSWYSWDSPHHIHTSVPSPTSSPPPQPHIIRKSECAAPEPIYVSLAEKSERGRRGLCFYCPEKWVHGHVCHTKLLAYYEEEDPDDQQWENDLATDEENDDAHPEPRVSTELGVIRVQELHTAEAFVYQKLLDVEAELPPAKPEPLAIKVELHSEVPPCFAEPVIEVLKRTVHPCMSAAPKLHLSPALLACTYEALYQGPFGLVESMESIWFHVLISRRVFDPGGDISPPLPLCFTSLRSSWFVATWYPP